VTCLCRMPCFVSITLVNTRGTMPILQMRQLRFNEVRQIAQCHSARRQHCEEGNTVRQRTPLGRGLGPLSLSLSLSLSVPQKLAHSRHSSLLSKGMMKERMDCMVSLLGEACEWWSGRLHQKTASTSAGFPPMCSSR
jgi:hypothetical protein